jgi:hypothetical protein
MKFFLIIVFSTISLLIASCSQISPTQPAKNNSGLPTNFAQADTLYHRLGTTMVACTANGTYGKLSVTVLQKNYVGQISDVILTYAGVKILRDSVCATDPFGVDVLVNEYSDIVVVLGDKDYQDEPALRKLIVNGDSVSAARPYGEAKVFNDSLLIFYQLIVNGPMAGTSYLSLYKRYDIYDMVTKSIVCQFDDRGQ